MAILFSRYTISLLLFVASIATFVSLAVVFVIHHQAPHLLFHPAFASGRPHYAGYALIGKLDYIFMSTVTSMHFSICWCRICTRSIWRRRWEQT